VLGEAYFQQGKIGDAIAAYERGLGIDPGNVPLMSALGIALRTAGRRDEAVRCFEDCIARAPSLGEAYYNLANLKSYRFSDEQIAAMKESVHDEAVQLESRINFHFALGKALEDRETYDESFDHYRAGNELRRRQRTYRPAKVDEAHERARKAFTAELLQRGAAESGSGEEAIPIFIVGLPRSGSTLVEQILASHSRVEGTRELPYLGRAVRHPDVARQGAAPYPEAFAGLSPDALRELGNRYLEATRGFRTGRPFFIDKMPNNFALIGAIRMMLPRARVINTCRHPLSTCVSAYKQLFFGGQVFSYGLSDLAHFYLRYRQLMTHWHEACPGFVLDVHYEDLVDDQENETRRLLDFCGLEFEEACLSFYETDRAVATASSEQVRQPIYRSSLEVWRPFEPYIGELIEGLEPVLRGLPPQQQPRCLQM
jgi:tetratricopeptide (TPR) repeat protein